MRNLAAEIKNGDINAFKELFDDYYPMLCVFAGKYIKNDEACKDIAQEALLSYWENRMNFDDIYKVKGFLYKVVHNRCLNDIKHNQIRDKHLASIHEENTVFEAEVLEQETYLLVRKAVDTLPKQMRTIIQFAIEGMKNTEIAEKMCLAEGTVKTLKKIAYRKLRMQLQDYFYLLLFI